SQNKISPLEINENDFKQLISDSEPGFKFLVEKISGISTQTAKLIYAEDIEKTWKNFNYIFSSLKDNRISPEIVIHKDSKKIIALSFVHIEKYNDSIYKKIQFKSIFECIDYYLNLQNKTYLDDLKLSLIDKIIKIISSLNRRQKNLKNTLFSQEDIDRYQLFGNLILTNINNIKKGSSEVTLINSLSGKNELLTIKLDPSLSSTINAQKYFKKYKNSYENFKAVKIKQEMTHDEINYLEDVIKNIKKAEIIKDFQEIKDVLIEQGYIHLPSKKEKKRIKEKSINPKHFISCDRYKMLVGTNERENDFLTMHIARPNDLWVHVRDDAGAHVIIKNKTQCDYIPEKTIEEACLLAAYYSRSRFSSNVPISYTYRKYLNKPKGAPTGFVTFSNEKTLFITPIKERIEEIISRTQTDN
ncbi:MAG: DUF814 domain-containing protein, partial [Candidatus Firestonebacteria bacterium]|nr:DUF814 domain-containing protein [Candidatus Firestonebacteria bacterium]